MTDQLQGAIQLLTERVEQKEKELAEAKRLVNALCREAGQEPPYSDVGSTASLGSLRADQFYGKTPIVAAREFIEMKGRAITLDEILDGLTRGGFDFVAQGWSDELRLRSLSISIGKNTSIFHKLPNGYIGLVKFYPEIEAEKQKRTTKEDAPIKTEAPEDETTNANTKAANV